MALRTLTVTRISGAVGVAAGCVFAAKLVDFEPKLMLRAVPAALGGLLFAIAIAPRTVPLLERRSSHALWMFPCLGVATVTCAGLGLAIWSLGLLVQDPAKWDFKPQVVAPVFYAVAFGGPLAFIAGLILGVVAALVLRRPAK